MVAEPRGAAPALVGEASPQEASRQAEQPSLSAGRSGEETPPIRQWLLKEREGPVPEAPKCSEGVGLTSRALSEKLGDMSHGERTLRATLSALGAGPGGVTALTGGGGSRGEVISRGVVGNQGEV